MLSGPNVGEDLARIKVWNSHDTVVYSEDHSLIGRSLDPSDDLEAALDGHPRGRAAHPAAARNTETASEVGLGRADRGLRAAALRRAGGPPAGAFEIYLSYKPIAAAVARDKRTIALLLAIGLLLLWAVLYRIVAQSLAAAAPAGRGELPARPA